MADEEQTVDRGEFSEENAKVVSDEGSDVVSDDSLESIAGSLTDDDFSASSFEVHDMPTPTLSVESGIGDSSAFKQGESLEENTEVVSGSRDEADVRKARTPEVYTVRSENEISYAQFYEQRRKEGLDEDNFRGVERSDFLPHQRLDLDDFDQRKMSGSTGGSQEYELLEIEPDREPRRHLPFQKNARDDYTILKKLKK
jgi:hypothetical protein